MTAIGLERTKGGYTLRSYFEYEDTTAINLTDSPPLWNGEPKKRAVKIAIGTADH